jgi:hypothetical protein
LKTQLFLWDWVDINFVFFLFQFAVDELSSV